MGRRIHALRKVAVAVLAIVALVYLANASWLAPVGDARPLLIAHRGLGQPFDRSGLTGRTCTAARLLPAGHPFLENTIAGIRAAFDHGADMVEFDVHRTADDRFAVFHDWTLECRTNGGGRTRDHTIAALQRLDIGYGYTADGGRTFPFRGRGVGLMPSLEEVLESFPNRDFLIDIKGNDPEDGRLLAMRLPREAGREILVHGGPKAVAALLAVRPGLRTITRKRLKACLLRYLGIGWSGHVPAECRDTILLVPRNYARWLWGWPRRLNHRLDRVGSRLVLLGAYDGSGFSSGIDEPRALPELPPGDLGGVWTDRVDLIGPALGR